MALDNLGAKSTIESFEEASAEARTIRLWYDQSRLTVLEAYPWSFATKRLALTEHSEDPPTNIWAYRYQYPADCVKARSLQMPQWTVGGIVTEVPAFLIQPDAIPFDIEMDSTGAFQTILTNLQDAILVYTFDQTNPQHFDRQFVIALSYMLAFNIAIKVTGRKAVKDDMAVYYKQALMEAAAANLNEKVEPPAREADSIRARW